MNRERLHFSIVMLLTFGRAPLVITASLLMLVNVFVPSPVSVAVAIALMVASALTDMLDGHFARKWRVTSRLGALADPMMDKVFYAVALPIATFIALYNESITHALLLLTLDVTSMIRDQWVSFLRAVGSEYGADVRASMSGKIRTLIGLPVLVLVHLQLGLQSLRLHHPDHEGIATLPDGLLYGVEGLFLAVTLISAITYTHRFLPALRQSAHHDPAG